MTVDSHGNPCIATYFRPERTAVPQYHLVFHDGSKWYTTQVGERITPFSLSGGGTKRIPISRPKVLIDEQDRAYVIFRDSERGSRVTAAVCEDIKKGVWRHHDLTDFPVGLWEPSYDTVLWQRENILHLFVQKVGQGDSETLEDIPPQMISALECTF